MSFTPFFCEQPGVSIKYAKLAINGLLAVSWQLVFDKHSSFYFTTTILCKNNFKVFRKKKFEKEFEFEQTKNSSTLSSISVRLCLINDNF